MDLDEQPFVPGRTYAEAHHTAGGGGDQVIPRYGVDVNTLEHRSITRLRRTRSGTCNSA